MLRFRTPWSHPQCRRRGASLERRTQSMTNRERVLAMIRSEPAGLTDSEIRERTGVRPHQQVNQICRRLSQQGVTVRRAGPDGLLRNFSLGVAPDHSLPERHPRPRAVKRSNEGTAAARMFQLSISNTLFVVPCSGAKRRGGRRVGGQRSSVLNFLPRALAAELRNIRSENAPQVHLDESLLLPAAERYTGTLYRAADDALDVLARAGAELLIISGGYGVVRPAEAIGWYDHEFQNSMWPNGVVARCLAAYADATGATSVIGLLSGTTQYARSFRSVRWPSAVEHVFHVWPQPVAGAMVKAPRAQGEALKAFSRDQRLHLGWTSSDGLEMQIATLR